MNQPDPVPRDFGWRYVAWFAWDNAVSILSTMQAVFQAVTLDPTLVSHNTVHWLSIGNLVLIVLIAQIKKNSPHSPPPLKDTST